MCGIVYSKSLVGKPVNRTIAKRYLAQRRRGTDGFGFYTPETDRLTHNVREGRILSLLRRNKKATEILFHHRMPTSTANVRNACHPFSTKDYFEHNYVGVHNGVLWNEDELRKEHEKLGIDYVSEQIDGAYNDSEALIYDLARYIEGQVTHLTAEGSIAFIICQRDKKGKPTAVFFGRNEGNPLVMKKTRKSFTLSSEGKGENILPNTMYKYDYDTGVISMSPCRIPSYSSGSNFQVVYSRDRGGLYGDDFNEIDDYNRSYGLDGYGNPIYDDHDTAKQQYVGHLTTQLMADADQDIFWAVELGRQRMKTLQEKEEKLYRAVEVDNTADDKQTDDYYSAGDNLYYMKEAVLELERRMSGQSQMGFHYSPDSSQVPHYQYGKGGLEKIDPLTGYAHYPYAS